MSEPNDLTNLQEETVFQALLRVGACLGISIERSKIDLGDIASDDQQAHTMDLLVRGAKHLGVSLKEVRLARAAEAYSLIAEGYPLLLVRPNGSFDVFERLSGRNVEVSHIGQEVTTSTLARQEIRSLVTNEVQGRVFVAKSELECDSLSDATDPGLPHAHSESHHGHGHGHLSPLSRFLSLLKLDARDIWTVVLFAFVAGVLGLAIPLAVESLVNIVSWGTYLQPLVVVALMLLGCLGLAGVLRILQTLLVEIIQCRQFVRIVGDLSHRFPRVNQQALEGEYPREMANRLFDIMTIQKATAVLLLDGISIVLTTFVGLLLLAFYHPFLLGFDVVLLISMISITWVLGRGGIRTAIDESIVKYKVVHWLQDVIASPAAFKVNGGEELAIERANRLTTEYLNARKSQFRVVIRQVIFAIGLQIVASSVLLGLGGWLVIQEQLTLGQLVASELVVTTVVGAFAKAGKSLEKYYDLMAGIDKVGHLLDLPVDPRYELSSPPDGPVEVRWDELHFKDATSSLHIPAAEIEAGNRVAIMGDDLPRKSWLARSLAGLTEPHQGFVQVAGFEAKQAALAGEGRWVGYAGRPEIFHSTLQQNVDLGRLGIGHNRIREVMQQLGLWNVVIRLPEGLQTMLQTDGYPLAKNHVAQLILARAMVGQPRLLVVDGLLDDLNPDARESAWTALNAPDAPWTLVLVTNQQDIAKRCDSQLFVRSS
ncbi:ATP-binding cassette domain-containing protein [Novipirellula artificiosorum]|uniref:Putative multidrug resistance ABC transporter ATP-binding/permease protein YheI n=1 Tax=Novipirellula artificiosorum TaxID=2528016 RepID=A0A5C6D8Y2_9BACT|nr:ATP-binding cassette domain-containing protein [Novipirellula artificiosorum]TWU33402.1 putative multidrug resistance ABC transporter ATP-binding/permease protein YheI [Novipirellula artificiosorum]